jgi:protein-tyrosine phosphatase
MPSVLFVCLGNICRSPTAEAVFRQKASEAGLDIHIDSAGTSAAHAGEGPDRRSIAAGQIRGYSFLGQRSRRVTPEDFHAFDYILAMDESNLRNLKRLKPESAKHEPKLFLSFSEAYSENEVPDPYYGGADGFDHVLDLIEDASAGLLAEIQSNA